MLHATESQLKNEIKSIIRLLIEGNYQGIHDQNLLPFGNVSVLAERIQQYPGSITMPPDKVFDDFKFIELNLTEDIFFFQADFDLWFDNRESDLTAQFVPSRDHSKNLICLYDLHVL